MGSLIRTINFLFQIASFLIVARAFSSWIAPHNSNNPIMKFLYRTTEPILAPIRHFLGRYLNLRIPIDISPIVAIFLLLFLRIILIRLLTSLVVAI